MTITKVFNEVKARLPHTKFSSPRKYKMRWGVKLDNTSFVGFHCGLYSMHISKPTSKMPPSMPYFSKWG